MSDRFDSAVTLTCPARGIVTPLFRLADSVLQSWMSTTWAPMPTIPAVPAKAVPLEVSFASSASTVTLPAALTVEFVSIYACVFPWMLAISTDPPMPTAPAARPPTSPL